METETKQITKLLSIERANINPNAKNDAGLRELMSALSDELPIEEVEKVVRAYGYGN